MALAVAIIGPGALGRSIGAVLERGGARVSYVGRGGKVVAGAALEENALGLGLSFPESAGEDRIVLVTTKAYDTLHVVGDVPGLLTSEAVVSLQNGLGNVEPLGDLWVAGLTCAGATTHAAKRSASGEVETIALGETVIAPVTGALDESGLQAWARDIAAALTAHGLPTRAETDAQRLLWRKVVVSCGINALTALERCTNGALLERPAALSRAIAAACEARAIGLARGVDLADLDAPAALRAVCERTAKNRSSMLQDIEAGRPTEVREIQGAVVNEAKKLHLEAPVNAALLHEIESIEAPSLPRARAIPETLTRHG